MQQSIVRYLFRQRLTSNNALARPLYADIYKLSKIKAAKLACRIKTFSPQCPKQLIENRSKASFHIPHIFLDHRALDQSLSWVKAHYVILAKN